MTAWRQDLTYALRRLSKAPLFAAASVVSIGLGIAANSTIFSMVSSFLLRPAPVGDPARLVTVYTTDRGECCNQFAWPLVSDLRDQARSFSGLAAYYDMMPASVGGDGSPERVWGQPVAANFFDVAQVRMKLGRGFSQDEGQRGVIVLGYGLWQRRFAGDASVIGRPVLLSGRPFTVVGVAPASFRGLDLSLNSEFWVPLGNIDQLLPKTADYRSRNYRWLAVVARLQPGVTREAASAEFGAIAQRLANAHPASDKDLGFRLEPAGSLPPKLRSNIRMFLAALSVVVLLVLAIACANVANLLLAQASERQREMAVRLALGASRGQLLRQLLTESVLLGLGGGVAGLVLSLWATQALTTFRLPVPVPVSTAVDIDWRVVLYTSVLSVGSGILFGLAPAWAASRPILSRALKGEDILARPGRRWTLRNLLVIFQVSVSLVLLCATGLFLRSLESASGIDPGFRSSGVLMMSIDPQAHGYGPERTGRLLTELRRRVAAVPGVAASAWTDLAPLSMGGRRDPFHAEERPAGQALSADLYASSAGYFETLGIPFLAGRDFQPERPTGTRAAIVNQTFADRLFPHENPLGKRVRGGGTVYEIIGVVKDTKSRTIGEDRRAILYRPLDQEIGQEASLMGYTLLVRCAGGMATIGRAVRGEIGAVDSSLAVYNVRTMDEHLRDALFLPRLAGTLFGVFGVVGLLLAALGLYGVMSYAVSRRTREVGIRLALGAQPESIRRLVIGQGMLLLCIAVVLGLAIALAVAKLSTALLYGIRPYDLFTFTAAPVLLAVVAYLACWIPARRAAGLDPLRALRYE